MAVLIEGISIVVRCKAIIESYRGGQPAFVQDVPNGTLCADGELAAVSFMTPADAKEYVGSLERNGLRHIYEDRSVDIVVVDQNSGALGQCSWINVGAAEWNNQAGQTVTVCQLVPSVVDQIVAPAGWAYERSLTAQGRYVPGNSVPESLKFAGTEDGVDVFVDDETAERFYVRRS